MESCTGDWKFDPFAETFNKIRAARKLPKCNGGQYIDKRRILHGAFRAEHGKIVVARKLPGRYVTLCSVGIYHKPEFFSREGEVLDVHNIYDTHKQTSLIA